MLLMFIEPVKRRARRAKLTLEEKKDRINSGARGNFYYGMDRDIRRAKIVGAGRGGMLPWVREVYDRKEALLNKYLAGKIGFEELEKHIALFSKKELAKLKQIPGKKARIERIENSKKALRRP